jgi:hypothetical protein
MLVSSRDLVDDKDDHSIDLIRPQPSSEWHIQLKLMKEDLQETRDLKEDLGEVTGGGGGGIAEQWDQVIGLTNGDVTFDPASVNEFDDRNSCLESEFQGFGVVHGGEGSAEGPEALNHFWTIAIARGTRTAVS